MITEKDCKKKSGKDDFAFILGSVNISDANKVSKTDFLA